MYEAYWNFQRNGGKNVSFLGEVWIFYATVHVLLAIFFGIHENKDMPDIPSMSETSVG